MFLFNQKKGSKFGRRNTLNERDMKSDVNKRRRRGRGGDSDEDGLEDDELLGGSGTSAGSTAPGTAEQHGGLSKSKRLNFCIDGVEVSNQSLDKVDIQNVLNSHVEKELRECFDSFDIVGKKEITCQQMQAAFESFNIVIDTEECKEIIAEFDIAHTGKITWEDFRREMHDIIASGTTDTHIRMVFDMMDKNGDGKIGADEICTQFKKLGILITDEEAMVYMMKIDKEGRGFITYDMFREFCNSTDVVQTLWRESIDQMEDDD